MSLVRGLLSEERFDPRLSSNPFTRVADIAIDLGTANTLIQVRGAGIVIDEPSVVAVEKRTGNIVAVGLDAKRMLGRTPESIVAARPMRGGVIADVNLVERMLRLLIERAVPRRRWRAGPRAVACVPSGITEMERRAVRAAVLSAGAREVYLLSQSMAAAMGAGLPVTTPRGSMVVDIGGGTSEIGVMALGGTIANASIRTGGHDFDDAIAAYIRRTHNLLVGEGTAELIKLKLGSAYPLKDELEMMVKGQDLVSGIPKTIQVCSEEIRECIREPILAIVQAVRSVLEVTPPELSSDIMEHGIMLVGGGAGLQGIDQLLSLETRLPVHIDPEPLTTVVRGAGRALEDWKRYRQVLTT